MHYNLGKLKDQIKPQHNIIYFRKGPTEMSINITNRCPNSCCFCIRDKDSGWGVSNLYLVEDPSIHEIKEAINNAQTKGERKMVKKIKLCGYGEPILRVDILPEIIKIIREKYPHSIIQLTTTGWPLYHLPSGEDYFKKCVKTGLNQISLGLNALNKEDYQKYVNPSVNSKESFNQALDFIRLSKKLGLKVIISFVDFGSQNINEIKEFSDKFKCEYNLRKLE